MEVGVGIAQNLLKKKYALDIVT